MSRSINSMLVWVIAVTVLDPAALLGQAGNSQVFPQGQPFVSLVEDAIVWPVEPELNCELNAPCTGECTDECDGSCHQPVQIGQTGYLMNDEPIQEALSEADAMIANMELAGQYKNVKNPQELDAYFEKLAVYLVATIDSDPKNAATNQKAVKAAFEMVAAEKARSLKLEFSNYANQMQSNHDASLASKKFDSETLELLLHRMKRLESNQVRTFKTLETIQDFTNVWAQEVQKYVAWSKANSSPRPRKAYADKFLVDQASLREARKREVARLKKQMQALDERMQELQHDPVQPAQFLEPLYSADQLLLPIDPAKRR